MDDQDYNSVLDDYDKWLYPIINKLDDNDRQQILDHLASKDRELFTLRMLVNFISSEHRKSWSGLMLRIWRYWYHELRRYGASAELYGGNMPFYDEDYGKQYGQN